MRVFFPFAGYCSSAQPFHLHPCIERLGVFQCIKFTKRFVGGGGGGGGLCTR